MPKMNYLEESQQVSSKYTLRETIARSRNIVLNTGYKIVVLKSKVKKSLSTFIKQIKLFYLY